MDPLPPSSPPPSLSSSPRPGGFAAMDPKVRNLAIGLLVLAVVLLVGTFTSNWTSASRGRSEVGTGLMGMDVSSGTRSDSRSWGNIKEAPGDFQVWGYLGLLGGLGSAAGAAAMGVFAVMSKPNKVPLRILQIVLAVTAGVMLIFLIRLMTHKELKELSLGFSPVLAFGGLAGIFVVSNLLHKERGRV